MKILHQKGNTTLEVIAALVIFALAAAGLAVALPLAFSRAETWSEQKTLAWYLEKSMEEIRGYTYENLPVGSDTLSAEALDGRQLHASYATTLVVDTLNASNQKVWTEIAGPAGTPINGLLGTYYDNIDFTGTSVVKVDPAVDFDWGSAAPVTGIDADTFSVEWSGFIETPQGSGGKFTFYTSSDDGVKLWINDTLIIDNWTDHSTTEDSGEIILKAGKKYQIALRMYENGGVALASLSWEGPSISKQIIPVERLYNNLPKKVALAISNSGSGTTKAGEMLVFPPYRPEPLTGEEPAGNLQGLAGLYFDSLGNAYNSWLFPEIVYDMRFTGNSVARLDPTINFDWQDGIPVTSIPAEYFGAHWTGYVIPPTTGSYTFSTNTDDGVRLWVNNQLLINQWDRHSVTRHDGNAITLQAGQRYPITMDLFEWTGEAVAQLYWTGPSITRQIIPQNCLYPVFSPFEDTYIAQNQSSTNFGDNNYLYVRYSANQKRYSFLKFNMVGITGQNIKSATLRLYAANGGNAQFQVWQTAANWEEDELDWNPQPGIISSSALGSYTDDTDSGTFINIPLSTGFLSAGDGVYSLGLLATAGNNDVAFYSREIDPDTLTSDEYLSDRGPRLILDVAGGSININASIQYLTNNTNESTNSLSPYFRIVNNSATSIDLSKIKLRYWYSTDIPPAQVTQVFTCDWAGAGVQCRNITASVNNGSRIVSLNPIRSLADYYLEIGFDSSAGSLLPGESATVYMRIRNDRQWYYYQSNDYSFNATSSFFENTKVTAYYENNLFFGTEPSALSPGNAMYITAITRSGRNVTVNVKDENNNNLSGVIVTGRLNWGSSSTSLGSATTNSAGNATFSYNFWSQYFTFQVNSIFKADYTYDHLNPDNKTEISFYGP